MANKTWIGGFNGDDIFTAQDWSPAGVPSAGDSLTLEFGSATLRNATLPGLAFGGVALDPQPAILNLVGATKTGVGGGAFNGTHGIINITGIADLSVGLLSSYVPSTLIENVGQNSAVIETLSMGSRDFVTVNAADSSSTFIHLGETRVSGGSHLVINPNVVGAGTFDLDPVGRLGYSTLEFGGNVGRGETINVSFQGGLTVDHAKGFNAQINLGDVPKGLGGGFGGSYVNFKDILSADSYSYQNDLLSFYKGNTAINQFSFSATPGSFTATEGPGGVYVSTNDFPTAPLPVHLITG